MGRENFLSVKLNQLRLQLSLAVKLLLQSLCLKLANSLSLPLASCVLLPLSTQARQLSLLASLNKQIQKITTNTRNKPGLPLDFPNAAV